MSKPLAYPSTLDHRPRIAHAPRDGVVAEGLWSPSLARLSPNSQAKANAYSSSAISFIDAEESFSLRRGLDSISERFELSITSSVVVGATKKATRLGSPSLDFVWLLF